MTFNVHKVRDSFPILNQEINGKPLVYLDNGATTQKPNAVIDAISDYYRNDNSNVHRGAHTLSDRSTFAFEGARETVRQFLNASSTEEIIWTKGTTEGVNLIAFSWGLANLKPGDKVLVSQMEHHANIVPWQMVCDKTGATLEPISVNQEGEIDIDKYHAQLDDAVKFVSIVHVSNALGTVNPVAEMIQAAKAVGALTMVDGAQAVAHWPVDVQDLGCDFYAFSGHKLYGPTGIGVLFGRKEILEQMSPFMGGGEMIEVVTFAKTTYNKLPYKFEPGTPNIAGAIGLAAAINFVQSFDRADVEAHENDVLSYALEKAEAYPGLTVIGNASHRAGVLSFLIDGAHPHDIGTLLDQQGVAVRTGNHCAMPIMDHFGVPGTVRASFAMYNTRDDVDALFVALDKVKMFLL